MPDYDSLQVTVTTLLALCAIVMAFWGVIKVVKDVKHPSEERGKELEELKRHVDNDNRRLKELEVASKLNLQAQLVIIDHLMSPGGDKEETEALHKVKQDIQVYLINR